MSCSGIVVALDSHPASPAVPPNHSRTRSCTFLASSARSTMSIRDRPHDRVEHGISRWYVQRDRISRKNVACRARQKITPGLVCARSMLPPRTRHPESPTPRSRNLPACARSEPSSPALSPALRCRPRLPDLPCSSCSPPPPPRALILGSSPQSACSTPAHTPDRNPASWNSQSRTALHPRAIPPVASHNSHSAAPFALPPAQCVPHSVYAMLHCMLVAFTSAYVQNPGAFS
jgi:hypothetical protein